MAAKNFFYFYLFVLLTFSTFNLSSQVKPNNVIYNTYVSGDMAKWAAVINTLEKEQLPTVDKKMELLNYYYGYIGYLLSVKNYESAKKYMNSGLILIEELIKQSPKNATVFAYKGAFIGYRIALSKFKALTQGADCAANLDKALKLDPHNTQAHIDKGNMLFHTPRLFGGDKKLALIHFKQSVYIIEKNKLTENNWLYLYALSLTARTYEYLDQYENAKITYEKILRLEPNYKWVKTVLLPALKVKMK